MDATDYWTDAFKKRAPLIPHATYRSPDSESLRGAWDEEEVALRKAIALVRERRNTLTLPSILPAEILGYVFLALRDNAMDDWQGRDEPWDLVKVKIRRKKSWLSWIKISHVSRHWRSVAISLPSLWTEILLPSYHRSRTANPSKSFLERSREAAISLTGHLETLTDMGDDTVRCHLRHIRSVRLSRPVLHPETPHTQLLSMMMAEGMPLLETLVIKTETRERDFPFTLSREFLSTRAPRLQRLHINQGSFPWGVICQGMRYLSIHCHILDPSSLDSLSSVLQSLRAMQCLEFLSLSNILPKDPPANGELEISLPRLERLHLRGYRAGCLGLWEHLLVPNLTSFTGCLSDDRSDIPHPLALLPACFDIPEALPAFILYIKVEWNWSTDLYSADHRMGGIVNFAVSKSEPSFPPNHSRDGIPGVIITSSTSSVPEAHGQAYALASQAPTHATRSVHLDGVRWSIPEMLSVLSPAMQHLVELTLVKTSTAVAACEALLQSRANSDTRWLASLRTLKLDCNLAHVPPTSDGFQPPLRDTVTRLLAGKADSSGSLDTLILGGTGATHSWIEENWSGLVKSIEYLSKWRKAQDDNVAPAAPNWELWGD